MQVVAVAMSGSDVWRWRVVNFAGEVVEESHSTFPTISDAVAAGSQRLAQLDIVDRSVRRPFRSTSHLRRR